MAVPKLKTMQVEEATEQFKSGLFDCMELGCCGCMYGLCCPACAMASARTKYDTSNWCFNCMCIQSPSMGRNIIREGYHLSGTWLGDFCLGACCASCVVCQMMNEVNKRGRIAAIRHQTPQQWNFNPCDCSVNWGNCCYSCQMPGCARASIRYEYDGSNFWFNYCCLSLPLARSVIREGYGIDGTCMDDILWSVCCPVCAGQQLLNEVRLRGKVTKSTVIVMQP